jgi:hypothetical protein
LSPHDGRDVPRDDDALPTLVSNVRQSGHLLNTYNRPNRLTERHIDKARRVQTS